MVTRRQTIDFVHCSLLGAAFALAVAQGSEPDRAGIEYFEKQVRPVLVEHCFECHAGEKNKGGLKLDSRAGWTAGGDSGPAIVPGQPDESRLIQAVRYGGDYEMPPKGKLPDKIIAALERWVELGAPDPRRESTTGLAPTIDIAAGREFWSYRPVLRPPLPEFRDAGWLRTAVDPFVRAGLESQSLRPAPEADRAVLIRRLYFDLVGLPPTVEELDEFLADSRPDAYERLVERILASPRFGERWGRHWLDVARFAESMTLRGFVFKEAWRYRDYVIEVFNADRPFDQFVREQVAGDLLPAQSDDQRERQLVATAFLALGNINLEEQDKKQLEMDVIDAITTRWPGSWRTRGCSIMPMCRSGSRCRCRWNRLEPRSFAGMMSEWRHCRNRWTRPRRILCPLRDPR